MQACSSTGYAFGKPSSYTTAIKHATALYDALLLPWPPLPTRAPGKAAATELAHCSPGCC